MCRENARGRGRGGGRKENANSILRPAIKAAGQFAKSPTPARAPPRPAPQRKRAVNRAATPGNSSKFEQLLSILDLRSEDRRQVRRVQRSKTNSDLNPFRERPSAPRRTHQGVQSLRTFYRTRRARLVEKL